MVSNGVWLCICVCVCVCVCVRLCLSMRLFLVFFLSLLPLSLSHSRAFLPFSTVPPYRTFAPGFARLAAPPLLASAASSSSSSSAKTGSRLILSGRQLQLTGAFTIESDSSHGRTGGAGRRSLSPIAAMESQRHRKGDAAHGGERRVTAPRQRRPSSPG